MNKTEESVNLSKQDLDFIRVSEPSDDDFFDDDYRGGLNTPRENEKGEMEMETDYRKLAGWISIDGGFMRSIPSSLDD